MGVKTPSPKIVKTFPGPIRSFTVKENNFGSAVSEILRDRQKRLLLYIIGYQAFQRDTFLLSIWNLQQGPILKAKNYLIITRKYVCQFKHVNYLALKKLYNCTVLSFAIMNFCNSCLLYDNIKGQNKLRYKNIMCYINIYIL